MSRAAGSFAGFFPSAPSVQQQKRKRAAADRDKPDTASTVADAAADSPRDSCPPPQDGHHKRRRTSTFTQDREDRDLLNGEAGDLLNGIVGSASSTSTVSSVFSSGALGAMSSQPVAGASPHTQTPLTVPESSPRRRSVSPRQNKPHDAAPLVNGNCASPSKSSHENEGLLVVDQVMSFSPQERIQVRPGPGEVKGERVFYDPQLDPKYRKLLKEEREGVKLRTRPFGQLVSTSSRRVDAWPTLGPSSIAF